jgi:hypothetical protein
MTAPPVPAEVDLRDFPFVPVFRQRLLHSRFNHLASDAEWRAGFMLWLASWDQTPGGSLPSDDRELCQLAGLGRDTRQWRKVKKWALYNWQLCDDGRLYHPVVAEVVNNAWAQKQANRDRTSAASEARRKHRDDQRNDHRDDQRNDQRDVQRDVNVTVPLPHTPSPEGEGRGRVDFYYPERKESLPRARANGHARGEEKINESGLSGRFAPLRAEGAPFTPRHRKKELRRQKVMRFAQATLPKDEAHLAFLGLMGEDPQHSAQSWLDQLDQQMRAARWDDTA